MDKVETVARVMCLMDTNAVSSSYPCRHQCVERKHGEECQFAELASAAIEAADKWDAEHE